MLKDYGHIARELEPQDEMLHDRLARCAAKTKDVCEFLAELGLVPPDGQIKLRAVYQDACHLAHAQRVRDQPRQLLSCVNGLTIVPIAEPDICCGAAGSYNLTEPEMSDRLAQRKLQNILAVNPQAVITGNVGCSMQIQAALRQARRDIWVAHPMELLDLSYRGAAPPVRGT